MAIKRFKLIDCLSIDQRNQIRLAKEALNAILQLNGSARVLLKCNSDSRIRAEIESFYSKAGWYVEFVRSANTEYYFVDILAVAGPLTKLSKT